MRDIIYNLMKQDGTLDSIILDMETDLKRDFTKEEELDIVDEMVADVKNRMQECSMNAVDAYCDIMY